MDRRGNTVSLLIMLTHFSSIFGLKKASIAIFEIHNNAEYKSLCRRRQLDKILEYFISSHKLYSHHIPQNDIIFM